MAAAAVREVVSFEQLVRQVLKQCIQWGFAGYALVYDDESWRLVARKNKTELLLSEVDKQRLRDGSDVCIYVPYRNITRNVKDEHLHSSRNKLKELMTDPQHSLVSHCRYFQDCRPSRGETPCTFDVIKDAARPASLVDTAGDGTFVPARWPLETLPKLYDHSNKWLQLENGYFLESPQHVRQPQAPEVVTDFRGNRRSLKKKPPELQPMADTTVA